MWAGLGGNGRGLGEKGAGLASGGAGLQEKRGRGRGEGRGWGRGLLPHGAAPAPHLPAARGSGQRLRRPRRQRDPAGTGVSPTAGPTARPTAPRPAP